MKKEKGQSKILNFSLLFSIFTSLFLISPGAAAAQTAEPFVFLTWRADSYAPADFRGKVLPTAATTINAAVEVITNGKITDLSRATINWYWNNNLIASGENLRKVAWNAPGVAGNINDLQVEIIGTAAGILIKTVEVPVVPPEVVIEAPFPERTFSGNQIILVAKPYFFSPVPNIIFDWRVNGEAPKVQDNSGILEINIAPNTPPDFRINAELTARNLRNTLERAAKTLSLIFKP
jgi:hypothetical protein